MDAAAILRGDRLRFRTNILLILIIIAGVFLVSLYLFSQATGESFCGLLWGIILLFFATILMLVRGGA